MNENINQSNNPYSSGSTNNPYTANTNSYQQSTDPFSNSYYESENTSVGNRLKAISSDEVVSKSFLFMFVALLITAFSSLRINEQTAYSLLVNGNIVFYAIGLFASGIIASIAVRKDHLVLSVVFFTIYCYLIGIDVGFILLAYTASSIAGTFFVTAFVFGAMAIYGLITKKDLTQFGTLFLMGLMGCLLMSVLNIFILKSSSIDLLISIITMILFVGIVAYDAKRIKNLSATYPNRNVLCLAMYGAFDLYLDFINIFLRLIRILGKRK